MQELTVLMISRVVANVEVTNLRGVCGLPGQYTPHAQQCDRLERQMNS